MRDVRYAVIVRHTINWSKQTSTRTVLSAARNLEKYSGQSIGNQKSWALDNIDTKDASIDIQRR